ncbi:hypothetical protein [Cyanobium usitatum]
MISALSTSPLVAHGLCLLALVRVLVPSSATWPKLTSPAFWQSLST